MAASLRSCPAIAALNADQSGLADHSVSASAQSRGKARYSTSSARGACSVHSWHWLPSTAGSSGIGWWYTSDMVTTAPGWKELYRDWIAGGWNSLTGTPDYGGQGLPTMMSVAVSEMWNSGTLAFAIAPTLTMGAVEALEKHA